MTDSPSQVETPSGKGAGDENFPVGSFLLPRRLRPHVAVFYAYARAIDDIADNPELAPEDKVARLDRMAAAIEGRESGVPALATAERMRQSLLETDITTRHCLDLISAFQQDAVKLRYDDWADLLDYCDRSANPVGRYLLDLHGESPDGYPASDALCSALQVLNHLQDCQDDYLTPGPRLPARRLDGRGRGHGRGAATARPRRPACAGSSTAAWTEPRSWSDRPASCLRA